MNYIKSMKLKVEQQSQHTAFAIRNGNESFTVLVKPNGLVQKQE